MQPPAVPTATSSVGARFDAAVASDPARPMLTWYDDATGERTELSGATLANWVAKTANLLVDGGGLGPGDRAGVLLPAHWQTAAVLLGCWSAGVSVQWLVVPAGTTGSPGTAPEPAGAPVGSPGTAPGPDGTMSSSPGTAHGSADAGPEPGAPRPEPVHVLFAAAPWLTGPGTPGYWPADETYALGLAPMAAPLRTVPAAALDYVVEVRGHGDRFSPVTPIGPGTTALVGATARVHDTRLAAQTADRAPQSPEAAPRDQSPEAAPRDGGQPNDRPGSGARADQPTVDHGEVDHGELVALAARRADALGIRPGDRVLIDADRHPDPLDWLLAPLLTGASVVLCGHLDPARLAARRAAERVTVTLD